MLDNCYFAVKILNNMKYCIGLIFSLLTSCLLLGQDQEILNHDIEINIKYSGGEFDIREKHSYTRLIHSERNIGASESISFSSLDKLVDFNAQTDVLTDKGKYKTQKVKTSKTVSQDTRGVFYSGREKLTFDYPSAVKNSICKVNYEKLIVDPQFLSSFIIAERYPVKEFTFKVTYPENIDFEMDLLNTDSLAVEVSESREDNIITKTVKVEGVPEYQFLRKLKSPLYIFPQILTRIKSVKTKKGTVNVGNDLSDLYQWYAGLMKRIPESVSHIDLKNKVEELTYGLPSDEEKIRVIYAWVQDNIEYIAFEDGMNGFIPRNADHIFEKRYGDCKDMANLLKTMLEHAEIPAYLTWIGTRAKPYSYEEVPSVCTDNHMICSVKINGEYVFLDATNQNIRLHVVPQGIQGKEALIGVNDTLYDLVKVPVTPKQDNVRIDKIKLTLNDKVLQGEVNTELKGYFKDDYDLIASYREFRKQEDYHLDLLNIGGESYTVALSGHEQTEERTKVHVVSNFENKIIKAGSKLYVNVSLNDFYNQLQVEDLKDRAVGIHEDYKFKHQVITTLEIPEGYTLGKQTDSIEYKEEHFEYAQSFIQEEGHVKCIQNLEIDFINLKPSYFEAYEQFLETVKKAEKQKIILIKS